MNKKNIVITIITLLGVLIAGGLMYQRIMSNNALVAFEMPGAHYEVNGKNMHMYCTGPEIPDMPTVIFMHDYGDSHLVWKNVQKKLSETRHVCSYDRPGYGFSDPSPRDGTHMQAANELKSLLDATGIQKPFLLAGHGLGASHAQVFAAEYPEYVKGLFHLNPDTPLQDELKTANAISVITDPAYSTFYFDFMTEKNNVAKAKTRTLPFKRILAWFGLQSLVVDTTHCEAYPEEDRNFCYAQAKQSGYLKALSEKTARPWTTPDIEVQNAILNASDNHHHIIVSRNFSGLRKGWFKGADDFIQFSENLFVEVENNLHEQWTRTLPIAEHLIANEAGHYIQFDEPKIILDLLTDSNDDVAEDGVTIEQVQ